MIAQDPIKNGIITFLQEERVMIIRHSAYSPDLAPSVF